MFQTALVLLAAFQTVAAPLPPAEIKDAVAHAEALYYSAHFADSVALLARIDQTLTQQSGPLKERAVTKMLMGLAYVGLNDNAQAKAAFLSLFAVDPDYAVDKTQFPPKVLSIVEDARAEQAKERCYAAQTEARADIEAGKLPAFQDLLKSLGGKCPVLAAIAPEAAETMYRNGMAAYKAGDFLKALNGFEAALTLSPEHDLAREYADLTRSKLQFGQDRLLAQWQKDYGAKDFSAAGTDYRAIKSSAAGSGDTKAIAVATAEYRKALTGLVDNWNQTCMNLDAANQKALVGQISSLIPEPSFGADIRGQMKKCEEEPRRVPVVSVSQGCLAMDSQLAMARLKTRVDPVIPDELRGFLKNNGNTVVRVKARISETGDLTITSIDDSNPILGKVVRDAVSQWKFVSIRDSSGIRCVDTEISLALKFRQ
jgi:tetratricopeptide (TPR) repeat protein